MRYRRMPIEIESPEEIGYRTIRYNLAESSMPDRRLSDLGLTLDLDGLLLQYGDHRGHPGLRAMLAAESGTTPDQVILTPGAAGALFIVTTSLLDPAGHLVVLRPNYATNVETPRAIGCDATHLDLTFDQGFGYTADSVAACLRPATRLVSITTPHNPTGVALPDDELDRIVRLVESRGIHLLVDETYRDLTVAEPGPFAAARSPAVISVGSFSKAYGLPGLRLGWVITRDPRLAELFLAAKEQITITGPVIDEEIGYRVYQQRQALRPEIGREVARRIVLVKGWVERQQLIEWVEPTGGVVCFPRVRPGLPFDADGFYQTLTHRFGTYVGPGHWFEQDRRHFRLGFGWPALPDLEAGLAALSAAAAEATGLGPAAD